MLKTSAYGLGFQHLPRDLAKVNAWKTMFDPYIQRQYVLIRHLTYLFAAACVDLSNLVCRRKFKIYASFRELSMYLHEERDIFV